jgi:hypothetical protein
MYHVHVSGNDFFFEFRDFMFQILSLDNLYIYIYIVLLYVQGDSLIKIAPSFH